MTLSHMHPNDDCYRLYTEWTDQLHNMQAACSDAMVYVLWQ